MTKKTHSIDWFYAKLDKHIKLLQAYSEVEGLAFITKACRLKPRNYVLKENYNRTELIREWYDEFSNSLTLENKTPKIIYNDLSINRSKLVCTDLYSGIALPQLAKISSQIFLIAGKDEDKYEDYFFLSFLGIDGYLRSHIFMYGEWQQVSPLMLGIKNLQLLYNNLDSTFFVDLDKKKSLPSPCVDPETWISCLPVSEGFLQVMKQKYEKLLPILGENANTK